MTITKRILSTVLVLLLLVGAMIPAAALVDPSIYPDKTQTGISFAASPVYYSEFPITKAPLTVGVWLKLPVLGDDEEGGTILGNRGGDGAVYSFEITKGGSPRYYISDGTNECDVVFDQIDLRANKWINVAVSVDPASGTFICYINGAATQTVQKACAITANPTSLFAVGGDLREGNPGYFKGSLAKLVAYAETRTADQINKDVTKMPPVKEALLYLTLKSADKSGLTDLSLAKNSFSATPKAVLGYKPVAADYAFAVVPDSQIANEKFPDKIPGIVDFILKTHEEDTYIPFMMHMGDITNTDGLTEWELAGSTFHRLDGIIPYAMNPGNHDYASNGYRDATRFNDAFPLDTFKQNGTYGGCFEEGKSENIYNTFTAGGLKYLVLTLEFGARDVVLEWANKVCADHPDYNIIVTTHGYTHSDGTRLQPGNKYVPSVDYSFLKPDANDGPQIFEKLISKHPNIVMTLAGHIHSEKLVVSRSKGDAGNTIVDILCDSQDSDTEYSGIALVMLMKFNKGSDEVILEYYSTGRQAYFLPENQVTIKLDNVVQPKEEVPLNDWETEATTAAPVEPTDPEVTTAPVTPDDESDPADKTDDKAAPAVLPIIIIAVAVVAVVAVVIVVVMKKKK
jgi:hypothetical protein